VEDTFFKTHCETSSGAELCFSSDDSSNFRENFLLAFFGMRLKINGSFVIVAAMMKNDEDLLLIPKSPLSSTKTNCPFLKDVQDDLNGYPVIDYSEHFYRSPYYM
jgi:hypothetical protein